MNNEDEEARYIWGNSYDTISKNVFAILAYSLAEKITLDDVEQIEKINNLEKLAFELCLKQLDILLEKGSISPAQYRVSRKAIEENIKIEN